MLIISRNLEERGTVRSSLDTYYASLLEQTDSSSNLDNAASSTNEFEDNANASQSNVADYVTPDVEKTANIILTQLAMEINMDSISKFNISRSFIWAETK